MDIRAKFQLKSGQSLELVDAPDSVVALFSDLKSDDSGAMGEALLVFVVNAAVLENRSTLIVTAAAADRLTWVAYPKSKQLGTDLNRDTLAAFMLQRGIQPVRQIALDDVWSALRFRPS